MSTVQHETGEKWFNSPVTRYEGLLPEVEAVVPVFERLPFAVEQVSRGRHAANERLEMIVRKASGAGDAPLPVGIVSKEYALVQHREVVAAAGQSLLRAGIDPRSVRVALRMTQYGERMAVSFFMPEEYRYDPGDGRPMGLRLECVNSVDGSTRFRAMMGWFRFVCSNGLVIGTAHTDLRRRHSGAAHVSDMQRILEAGLKNLAELVDRQLQCDINVPGAGAAGGLAGGAIAMPPATRQSGSPATGCGSRSHRVGREAPMASGTGRPIPVPTSWTVIFSSTGGIMIWWPATGRRGTRSERMPVR